MDWFATLLVLDWLKLPSGQKLIGLVKIFYDFVFKETNYFNLETPEFSQHEFNDGFC